MPESAALQSLRHALYHHSLVLITDLSGRIVYASEKYLASSGYALEELLGHSYRDLAPGDQGEGFLEALTAESNAGQAWQGVLENRRKDDTSIWLQTTALVLRDGSDDEGRCVLIGTDVSDRERQRRAYEALVNPGFDLGLFHGIARAVAQGLGSRGAGVGRLVDAGREVELLGYWFDDTVRPNITYALAGTPCETTMSGHEPLVVIERDIADLFPRDRMLAEVGAVSYRGVALHDAEGRVLGVLFAIDDRPCRDDANDRAFLKVAAARAAEELMRAAAEERIRDSEARLRLALEAASLGMWDNDLETGKWICNDRWWEIRGYRRGEFDAGGEDWRSMTHPADLPTVSRAFDAAVAGKREAYELEYRVQTKSGAWRWLHARATAVKRKADGRASRMIGIQMDVHDRRLAEEALRENQQWLQLTVDAAELGIWDWRAPDQLTFNPRAAAMLGYTLDEMPKTATDWIALNHPDDQIEANRQFIGHLRGELDRLRLELRSRARDGRWVWLLSHGRVIERDANGRALRAVGTHQDISQLKYAEAALHESEARLRAVIESSPVGMFLSGPEGGVVYRNQTLLKMHGESGEHDLDHRWEKYIHPEDRLLVVSRWQQYVAKPEGQYELEWRAISEVYGPRLVLVRALPVMERGRVLGFAGTVEDVTDRRAAEQRELQLQQQLQQTQKMEAIGQLTGGIAHDFNNSLASILGFATLALARTAPPPDEKLRQYLETIVEAGEHARDLVHKLLAFSRSSPTTDRATTAAQPLIRKAMTMLKPVIPSTIQLESVLDDAAPLVQIHATDLHQIIFNLVLNARDAISGHGHIRVRLRAPARVHGLCSACRGSFDGELVEIAVTDDGSGIALTHINRVFDPFFSTKEVGKGSGMGLSVLHGIVHRAGGHVLVESGHGAGTTIRVFLRPGVVEAEESAEHALPAPRASGDSHVLVVDDDPAVARFVCELLDANGYSTTDFGDPLAALAWARNGEAHIDAVISDQTMPGLTGLELARELNQHDARLPVLLCTGLSDRIDMQLAREAGVKGVFLKPVPVEELLCALADAVAAADTP